MLQVAVCKENLTLFKQQSGKLGEVMKCVSHVEKMCLFFFYCPAQHTKRIFNRTWASKLLCAGCHYINCVKTVFESRTQTMIEPNARFLSQSLMMLKMCCLLASCRLTEHGVELLWVEVPLPPGCLVTLGLGIVGMVELRFRPEWVQHPQHAPMMLNKDKECWWLLRARSTDVCGKLLNINTILYMSVKFALNLVKSMKPRNTIINHLYTDRLTVIMCYKNNRSHVVHTITHKREAELNH